MGQQEVSTSEIYQDFVGSLYQEGVDLSNEQIAKPLEELEGVLADSRPTSGPSVENKALKQLVEARESYEDFIRRLKLCNCPLTEELTTALSNVDNAIANAVAEEGDE